MYFAAWFLCTGALNLTAPGDGWTRWGGPNGDFKVLLPSRIPQSINI